MFQVNLFGKVFLNVIYIVFLDGSGMIYLKLVTSQTIVKVRHGPVSNS